MQVWWCLIYLLFNKWTGVKFSILKVYALEEAIEKWKFDSWQYLWQSVSVACCKFSTLYYAKTYSEIENWSSSFIVTERWFQLEWKLCNWNMIWIETLVSKWCMYSNAHTDKSISILLWLMSTTKEKISSLFPFPF